MRPAIGHRYFFALLPPADVAQRIGGMLPALGPGRPLSLTRFHVTLAVTDDHPLPPLPVADRMMRVADAVVAPCFRLVLDRLVGSTASIALRPGMKLDRLLLLQRQLERDLARTGIRRRAGWRFNPHLTLLYRSGVPFFRPIDPIAWHAEELVLIHSHVGLTRHDVLGRWSLAA